MACRPPILQPPNPVCREQKTAARCCAASPTEHATRIQLDQQALSPLASPHAASQWRVPARTIRVVPGLADRAVLHQ